MYGIHTEKEKGSQSQWPRHTAQGSPSHLRHTEFAKIISMTQVQM